MIRRATTAIVVASVLTILASAALVPTKAAFVDHTAAGATFAAAESFPPHTVAGRVTSTLDGSGVTDITVTLDDSAGTVRTGVTDGNGAYQIPDVPPGTYEGQVAADGFASDAPLPVHVDGDLTEVDFQVTPLFQVEGRVTLALGLGLTNANVRFVHDDTGEVYETRTYRRGLLGAGYYELSDVRAGSYTVTITHLDILPLTESRNVTTHRLHDVNPKNFEVLSLNL